MKQNSLGLFDKSKDFEKDMKQNSLGLFDQNNGKKTDTNEKDTTSKKYGKMGYNVDFVFCIDATESMKPVLDIVKNNALNIYDDFIENMEKKQKSIGTVRIKVIVFRDSYFDWKDAMYISEFFEMPSQKREFESFVKNIEHRGGGDDPEDGLEALSFAMQSDWNKSGLKKRHVIAVWSDAGTHKLGFGKMSPYYPKGMVKNFNQLSELWGIKSRPGAMDQNAKRLILFTPGIDWWTTIRDNWNHVIHYESKAGQGLDELDYNIILNSLCNSI